MEQAKPSGMREGRLDALMAGRERFVPSVTEIRVGGKWIVTPEQWIVVRDAANDAAKPYSVGVTNGLIERYLVEAVEDPEGFDVPDCTLIERDVRTAVRKAWVNRHTIMENPS